ncbi:Cytochrome b-c1 complex subunit 6 [Zea mays]|uniref:Cytochrome b-c1 complex subunit 6 n=1 Tax=Zea mays TaxID=4577 RepID=A0A1D6Q2W8_MAIZE|nr:Cytochrome b-c1 complex subunit 6 [Zea mays]
MNIRNVLRGLRMTRLGTNTVPASTLITGNVLTRMLQKNSLRC